jgi:hypothetical protein
MTARSVATTDTLETFRTTFNSLSSTDIGDPASLTTTATSIVGAINEINTSVLSTGFKIADDTSSVTETIAVGDVLRISNGSNITATVSATDTVTVALNSTITGLTSVSATTGTFTNLTVGGVSVATNAFAIAQAVALG